MLEEQLLNGLTISSTAIGEKTSLAQFVKAKESVGHCCGTNLDFKMHALAGGGCKRATTSKSNQLCPQPHLQLQLQQGDL